MGWRREGEWRTIFAMPAALALTELLDVRDIHLQFQAVSVIEAIPTLLRPPLIRRFGNDKTVEAIIAAVIAREKETTTLCGALALPHGRHAAVDDFVLSLGSNAAGAIAGQTNPRIIFAFVSPEGKREQHLQLLASLARLSQNANIVDHIASASTADQVLDALRSVDL